MYWKIVNIIVLWGVLSAFTFGVNIYDIVAITIATYLISISGYAIYNDLKEQSDLL